MLRGFELGSRQGTSLMLLKRGVTMGFPKREWKLRMTNWSAYGPYDQVLARLNYNVKRNKVVGRVATTKSLLLFALPLFPLLYHCYITSSKILTAFCLYSINSYLRNAMEISTLALLSITPPPIHARIYSLHTPNIQYRTGSPPWLYIPLC